MITTCVCARALGQMHGKMNGHQINYAFLVVPLHFGAAIYMRPMLNALGPYPCGICNEYAILMSWNCALWAHIAVASWKLNPGLGEKSVTVKRFLNIFHVRCTNYSTENVQSSSAWARRSL